MTTATAIQFFVALNADAANRVSIDGIGHTAQAAIDDALTQIGYVENVREGSANGDVIEEAFVARECTKELYDLVVEQGGRVDFDIRNGRVDVVVDEGDVSTVVDFCKDGVEKNEKCNDAPISGWTGVEAVEIYVDEMSSIEEDERDNETIELLALVKSPALRAEAIRQLDAWISEHQ